MDPRFQCRLGNVRIDIDISFFLDKSKYCNLIEDIDYAVLMRKAMDDKTKYCLA